MHGIGHMYFHFYHLKSENIYLLTWVIHMAVFPAYARHTITFIRSIGVGTCSIPTWIEQAFVNVYFTMSSFPTISTNALIIVDAVYTPCTIHTRAWLAIVVVDVAMFAFIPRQAIAFVALKYQSLNEKECILENVTRCGHQSIQDFLMKYNHEMLYSVIYLSCVN